MKPDIVVIGSLNADFVVNVAHFPRPGETLAGRDFEVFPGGKGANQAYAAARLGERVRMIGQVGHDAQAEWLRHHLAQAGVDVCRVRSDASVSSGVAIITIDGQGQNQIVIVAGANGTFRPELIERDRDLLSAAGMVLLQLEIPIVTVEAAAQHGKAAGAKVILDPAPAQPLPDDLLRTVDYLTPNETELAILTAAKPSSLSRQTAATLARQLLIRGAPKVIVKLGAQGALLVTPEREHFWPAFNVRTVDTTAAGDAFNAAFASALVRGCSEIEAGRFATAAAACSVMRPGAQPSMPTRSEVEALLGQALGTGA
jgi:ribokinase